MWFNNRKKNIVVTGAKGQLGSYLVRELSKLAFAERSSIGQVLGIDIDDLDLTDSYLVSDFFNKHVIDPHVSIDYVVHCAAATDTTAIEKDPLKFYAANVIASRNVAKSCAFNGIKLIHISTDYVMSELSPVECGANRVEFPVNQYGMQKLLAEKEVQTAYASKPNDYVIGRLSWLFGNSSNSFVEKFLRSAFKTYADARKSGADGHIQHKVVGDAYGKPTPVWLVLEYVMNAIDAKLHGTYDFQYESMSQISRFEWALMILHAFYDMLENRFWPAAADDKINELVKDMQERLEIIEVKSSDLNLSMRHPGLVAASSAMPVDVMNEYELCTKKYIDDNSKRLVQMMTDVLEEVK